LCRIRFFLNYCKLRNKVQSGSAEAGCAPASAEFFFVFKRAFPKHVIKVREKRQKTGDKLVKKYKTG